MHIVPTVFFSCRENNKTCDGCKKNNVHYLCEDRARYDVVSSSATSSR